MKLEDFPRLRDASPEDKLALIDALWDTIPPDQHEARTEHLDVLKARLRQVQSDPSQSVSPAEATRLLRERMRQA